MEKTPYILFLFLFLWACSNNNDINTRKEQETDIIQNQTEQLFLYTGTYKGTIPAADCPGIDVTLTVNKDNTFQSKFVYQERNVTFEDQGLYTVNDSILTMIGENADTTFYKATGKSLIILDQNQQEIPDDLGKLYILNKQQK